MFAATAVLSIILAVTFGWIGVTKLSGQAQMVEGLRRLGVSRGLIPVIGALELFATAGLLIGLFVGWLGAAAAVGLVLLMAGAITYHVRAGDYKEPKLRKPAMNPVIFLLLAAVTTVLRIVTS